MARKEKPKPLFSLKGDFVDSLQEACQQGITLIQVCEQVISAKLIKNEGVAKIFEEHVSAFRDSLSRDE